MLSARSALVPFLTTDPLSYCCVNSVAAKEWILVVWFGLNFSFFAGFAALESLLPYLELPLYRLTREPSRGLGLLGERLLSLRIGFGGLYCIPPPVAQDAPVVGNMIDDDFIQGRAWLPSDSLIRAEADRPVEPRLTEGSEAMLSYHQRRHFKRQRSFDSDLGHQREAADAPV